MEEEWKLGMRAPATLAAAYALRFDALGEPRKRFVRISLDGSHMVVSPQECDAYMQDAKASDDRSEYVVTDVWLSDREFDDLPEFEGF